jgi:hypothetical protein
MRVVRVAHVSVLAAREAVDAGNRRGGIVTGVHNLHDFRNIGALVSTVVMNVMGDITAPGFHFHLTILTHLVEALADGVLW